jgi:hypothetical protein
MKKLSRKALHRLYSDGIVCARVLNNTGDALGLHTSHTSHLSAWQSFGALSLSCDYLKLSAEQVARSCLATCVEANSLFSRPSRLCIRRLRPTQVSSHVPSHPQCVRQPLLKSHGGKRVVKNVKCHAPSLACLSVAHHVLQFLPLTAGVPFPSNHPRPTMTSL